MWYLFTPLLWEGMWAGMDIGPLHASHHAELLNTHLLPQEAKARGALLTLRRNADNVG